MEYFTSSFEHLKAELDRIGLLIKTLAWRAHQLQSKEQDNREHAIKNVFNQNLGLPLWAMDKEQILLNTLDSLRQQLDKRIVASSEQGVTLHLAELKTRFNLTSIELDIVLLCLAGELDPNQQKLVAYLQASTVSGYPSIDVLLNLLSANLEQKTRLRVLFQENATLCKHQLIEIGHENTAESFLLRPVRLNERLSNYLFEHEACDKHLAEIAVCTMPQRSLDELILPGDCKEQVRQMATLEQEFCLYLQGAPGTGKRSVAEVFCQQRQQAMLAVDMTRLIADQTLSFTKKLQLTLREAMFRRAIVYYYHFDDLFAEENLWQLKQMIAQLNEYSGVVLLAGQSKLLPSIQCKRKPLFELKLTKPDVEERLQLWQQSCQRLNFDSSKLDMAAVASRFRLVPAQIQAAAHILYQQQALQNAPVTSKQVYKVCQQQATHQMSSLAQQIQPTYSLEDIVLPAACITQLKDVINYAKHHHIVYEKLGFGKKLAMGKGLNALFAGPPGTGKTMAAEIIADALDLELYKIDLAAIISKYIGDTEKNLSRIFDEAETSNAILFFDEADALFSKRSEVNDAHDKHANVETSYLLQRIEAYQGIVILATNFKRNLDEAFIRRLHFLIDFPFPDAKERVQIWRHIWPAGVKLSSEIDLNKLAEHLEIAGGNIRNVALQATFKAIDVDGSVANELEIDLSHIVYAAERELRKIGKIVNEEELSSKLLN
jgi:ATP-dependent 26S proteasome regulatory subunit